jgi:hypothetical protein
LATPNYGYEKRQRELAKKAKKQEKLKRKVDGKPDDDGSDGTAEPATDGSAEPQPDAPAGTPAP